MGAFNGKRLLQSRFAWAAASGLLLAGAYPKTSIAALAWLAPALMLFCATGQTSKRAFRIGYVAGVAFNLAALCWLNNIPYPVMPSIGWLALSAYNALYPALWVWLCWRIAPFGGQSAASLVDFSRVPLLHRALWCLQCAVLWVGLEMIHARFLSGFPWLALANSQYEVLPLIQIASVTGAEGITFLVVWTSVSLLCAAAVVAQRPVRPWAWLAEITLPLLVVAGVVAFGMKQLLNVKPPERHLTLALIQPSIPQTVKWDKEANRKAFARVLDLTRSALVLKPDVLVWPESATPGFLRYDEELHDTVTQLAKEHRVWIILGTEDAEHRESPDPDAADFFNSAFLVNPEGRLVHKYDKQRLVIFGEYVPLANWLPFLRWFTPVGQGFTPGKGPVPFPLNERATVSVLICFEDVFGFHTRHYVEPDTDFLLNLTNNGWFGESAAHWQHAAMSVLRCVESDVPMARCTNNGLTCWIDRRGRMHDVYFGDSKDVYGAGFKIVKLPLLARGEPRKPTLYRRYGDWFGWGCLILGVVRGAWCVRKRVPKAAAQAC